jgi:3',5'-cyclic AMP phosphodiesterase CpdA
MPFSIVIIPDTQILSCKHPEIFRTLAEWIVRNQEEHQIKMVLHLGDVVHNGAAAEEEFRHAKAALDQIDKANIPMLITPGNHDYDNMLKENRSLDMFNAYFGADRYKDKDWYGGAFEPNKTENVYARMNINGEKLLFLSLEFGIRDEVLEWANELLTQYADHKAIIITHCYMFLDGSRNKPGDAHNPKVYVGATGANDGEDMWLKCFRKHSNIIAIYSGHQIPNNISYKVDMSEHQSPVFQSFQNWQTTPDGGEGRIRLVQIDPEACSMTHRVFNTYKSTFEAEAGYQVHYCYSKASPSGTGNWSDFTFPLSV